jgi:hypothetical protein
LVRPTEEFMQDMPIAMMPVARGSIGSIDVQMTVEEVVGIANKTLVLFQNLNVVGLICLHK